MKGELFLVATPIGNLKDISERAIESLNQADIILCEDTRRTRALLSHLGIRGKKLISFNEHNQDRRIPQILAQLEQGKKIALASDAGTPAISDPGGKLVELAHKKGIKITPIPGASAITTALSASGFPAERFLFLGFLSAKAGERRKLLEKYKDFPETIVIFEAPHRIEKTIKDLLDVLGNREACLCRELTKAFEEIRRTNLSELLDHIKTNPPKGEITLILEGAEKEISLDFNELEKKLKDIITEKLAQGKKLKEIVEEIAKSYEISKNKIYKLALEIKNSLEKNS